MMIPHKTSATMDGAGQDSLGGIFLVFLRLGLTSFGGPIAHIGYFRDEFVQRRHWLSERSTHMILSTREIERGSSII